ncbi:hypothetical protein [Parapedobacter defluvii]|nr:hypothetical protein [Parapedobacter defluvii]
MMTDAKQRHASGSPNTRIGYLVEITGWGEQSPKPVTARSPESGIFLPLI